jgi:peptidyl-lysine (3S)-dioxygenase / protease
MDGSTSAPDSALRQVLQLIEDYHDFNPETSVPVFDYPTAIKFGQQVARGRPCVYRLDKKVLNGTTVSSSRHGAWSGVIVDGAAEALREEQQSILSADCFKWSKQSLCALVNEEVEVAITPDGRADSLYSLPVIKSDQGSDPIDSPGQQRQEQVFLEPASIRMTLSSLTDKLCPASPNTTAHSPVYYLQSQNSNLHHNPLSSLLPSLPSTPPPFALPVLGDPEATNIWIGNHQSVTSTHRDPYENLYLVIKGRKKFVLYAPVEEICLHSRMVRTGRWIYDEQKEQDKRFQVHVDEDGTKIPWVPIDPNDPPVDGLGEFPYHKYARPLGVTVNEGEILYLPSGWFHHVSQECGSWEVEEGRLAVAPCIAVNYWFDMDYSGERHIMREMLSRLVQEVRDGESPQQS